MFKIKFLLIMISGLVLSGCSFNSNSRKQHISSWDHLNDHQQITASIGRASDLKLEIVNTPTSISQGLSGREELGADGMLFIFDQILVPDFWMKDMKFNLDLVWIKQKQITEITYDVPAPGFENKNNVDLPTYSPSQEIEMVLEIPAGKAKEWDLSIGDLVEIK